MAEKQKKRVFFEEDRPISYNILLKMANKGVTKEKLYKDLKLMRVDTRKVYMMLSTRNKWKLEYLKVLAEYLECHIEDFLVAVDDINLNKK